jgi:hypothetical protein
MNPDQSCDHKGIIAQVGGVIQGFPSLSAFTGSTFFNWVSL